jgi:hypothetical protein
MSYLSTKKFILAILLAIGIPNGYAMDFESQEISEEGIDAKQEDDYGVWWKMQHPAWWGSVKDHKVWWKRVGQYHFDYDTMDGVPVPSLRAIFTGIMSCEKEVTQMLVLNRGEFLRSKGIGGADPSAAISNLTKTSEAYIGALGADNILRSLRLQELYLPPLRKHLKDPFIKMTKNALISEGSVNISSIGATIDPALELMLDIILKNQILNITSMDEFFKILNKTSLERAIYKKVEVKKNKRCVLNMMEANELEDVKSTPALQKLNNGQYQIFVRTNEGVVSSPINSTSLSINLEELNELWNEKGKQAKAYLDCDHKIMTAIMKKSGHSEIDKKKEAEDEFKKNITAIEKNLQQIITTNIEINKSNKSKDYFSSLINVHKKTNDLKKLINEIVNTDIAKSFGLTKMDLYIFAGLPKEKLALLPSLQGQSIRAASQFQCPTLEWMRNYKKPKTEEKESGELSGTTTATAQNMPQKPSLVDSTATNRRIKRRKSDKAGSGATKVERAQSHKKGTNIRDETYPTANTTATTTTMPTTTTTTTMPTLTTTTTTTQMGATSEEEGKEEKKQGKEGK